jgi:cell pole-organizing protein PopZ
VGQLGLGAKVDDLLANIRRSIDSDMDSLSGGTPTQTRGTLMRGTLREMRVQLDGQVEAKPQMRQDISDLRSRIQKKMDAMEVDLFAQVARTAPPPVPQTRPAMPPRSDFSGILSGPTQRPSALRPSFAEADVRDDLRYVPQPRQAAWQQPEPETYDYAEEAAFQQPDPYAASYEEPRYPALVSPQTEAHAETAFRQLSEAILARATGDKSLEDMTRDMLKGMLKQWLDANLPAIVEDMVREEIQRVARRGR